MSGHFRAVVKYALGFTGGMFPFSVIVEPVELFEGGQPLDLTTHRQISHAVTPMWNEQRELFRVF